MFVWFWVQTTGDETSLAMFIVAKNFGASTI